MKLKIQRSQSIQSSGRIDDLPSIAECEEEHVEDKGEHVENKKEHSVEQSEELPDHSEEHSVEQKQPSSQATPLQTTPTLSEEGISPQSSSVEEVPNWDAAALRIITFLSSRINPNVSHFSSLFIHRLVVLVFQKMILIIHYVYVFV